MSVPTATSHVTALTGRDLPTRVGFQQKGAGLSYSALCVISGKDIKFKKLSLISCKNIISLMDVSF